MELAATPVCVDRSRIPDFILSIETSFSSAMVETFAMAFSKSIDILPAATPTTPSGAVTFEIFEPTATMPSPNLETSSP